MTKPTRWLRSPRNLLLLFGAVVALPAATLVYLGVELLAQDRAVATQHRAEVLQNALDRAIRALDARLSEVTRQLSDLSWRPAPPALPGAVQVLVTKDDTTTAPAAALAYYPAAPKLKVPPGTTFAVLDAAEFRSSDLADALDVARRLATSSRSAVRAAAKQREARILRKMGHVDEALAAYDSLAAFTEVSLDGWPADLFGRRARCRLLNEQSRTTELRRDAQALAEDLDSGRWRLDRGDYEYLSHQLDEWGATLRPLRRHREASATAVDWLYRQAAGASSPSATGYLAGEQSSRSAGSRVLMAGDDLVTVVWTTTAAGTVALVAGPDYLRHWSEAARKAAFPARVSIVQPTTSRGAEAGNTVVARRTSAETGLPWTIEATLPANYDSARYDARRRMVFAGLGAVLVLVVAGSSLLVRSRQQEIALAQLQSDFVATVSHEFRTPLTALRQFNELLDGASDLAPERVKAYHQAQSRATERLSRLVESLLDFGRMEAGKRPYRFEALDAGPFVCDVVEEFRREIDGRGFVLRCHLEPGGYPVNADADALARALWNLLDNAVKYSGDGREIDVAVHGRIERTVAIAVSDKGIGIAAGEQNRVLTKFVRGSAAIDARIHGTGIGLAMTDHIVRAHGGRLRLESVETLGSMFTIELPLSV